MESRGRSRKKNTKKSTGRLIADLSVILLLSGLVFLLAKELVKTEPAPPETETPEITAAAGTREENSRQEITAAVLSGRKTEPETETESETEPPKYAEAPDTKLLDSRYEDHRTVTLTFAGDILFDPHYAVMASLLSRTGGALEIRQMFDENILAAMRSSDIFVVNNEFPYSDRGEPLEDKQFTFRASPASASLLTEMGADIAVLANNHMYDHGEAALLDTLDTLSGIGLFHIGAGRDLSEASAPVYFTNGRIKIGFLAATQIERMASPDTKGATETSPGVFRCMNSSLLLEKIGEMKEDCDFIVVYLHWGTESSEQVDVHQKKLAKEVADAGADLIIGDHPHVLQGIDRVNGVPVIYSLGNFLFNSRTQDTCLFTAELDQDTAELLSLRFLPARQEGCRTRLLVGDEQLEVIEAMRALSGVPIDNEGWIGD